MHTLRATVQKDFFKVRDTGDSVGTYAQYFGTGTIHGKFDLTPQEVSGDLTTTGFTYQTWAGKVTILGGTGAYAKAAGKKGILKCSSQDSVHLSCTEKLTLKQL